MPSSERDAPNVGDGVDRSSSEEAKPEDDPRALPADEPKPEDDSEPTAEWVGDGSEGVASSFLLGQVVGDRYRIGAVLGRGGMGEVWQAYDLKLRVEVALKTLHKELFANERGLELLRREVLSAREVVSPNVCRVFDLQMAGEVELVSMEYIDGRTLLDELLSQGPLELNRANEIASQLLAGLAAIHEAGLVHRDLKPENVMITRSGRVVIMDFGIAKVATEGSTGTVAGTPAYMSPEQMRGEAVDARADVFAIGIMLAEMVCPQGIGSRQDRRNLWSAMRELPPRVPDGPWSAVLARAVAADPDDRYRSAWALSRALEEVTLRVEGAENMLPYPGLASFTEADAEFFFGREAEVEALWKKLQPPHLLGLIGPSGAGKSSFVQAGLLPARPDGWRYVLCQPDDAPFRALAQALVPELTGDTEATQDLLDFDDVDTAIRVIGRWQKKVGEAVIIIDQFEELFTLNATEVQTRFATLLGRLPLETNIRVLLSMRDDFLFRCHEQPSLAPVFTDLTPIGAPSGAALRRALVQPALACGYRFEQEALVEEMVGEVSEERGALPLLAFAAAQLWEQRDRSNGTLTSEAYNQIGGVGGALAQHAEVTLEQLGPASRDAVREIFRNLVTAEGTRASREINELASVFVEPEAAKGVINALIDARLLTSYEVPGSAGESDSHKVEIVHESLLAAWPRLVRWQSQDKDGALLRDQLRQAAAVWEERGRYDELLWTGAAYREFVVWKEAYAGRLSDLEQSFERAMVVRANRQRSRRRFAVATAFAVLLAVATTVGILWKRTEAALGQTEAARQEAVLETHRAEASKLLTLAQNELRPDPRETYASIALAYAIAGLEIHDSPEARLAALQALWRGPVGYALGGDIYGVSFSPDGRWLAFSGGDHLQLWEKDSREPKPLGQLTDVTLDLRFSKSGEYLQRLSRCTNHPSDCPDVISIWRLSDGALCNQWSYRAAPGRNPMDRLWLQEESILRGSWEEDEIRWEKLASEAGAWEEIARMPFSGSGRALFSMRSTGVVLELGKRLWLARPGSPPFRRELAIGLETLNPKRVVWSLSADDSKLAVAQASGPVHVAPLDGLASERIMAGEPNPSRIAFDPPARRLAVSDSQGRVLVWDLEAPRGHRPLTLQFKAGFGSVGRVALESTGWVAASGLPFDNMLWPIPKQLPRTLVGHSEMVWDVKFSPDTRWLYSASGEGKVIRWPLATDGEPETVFQRPEWVTQIAISPDGQTLLVSGSRSIWSVSTSGGEPQLLESFPGKAWPVAFDAAGHRAATSWPDGALEQSFVRIWDFESGEKTTLGPIEHHATSNTWQILFTPENDRIITAGEFGVMSWNIEGGGAEYLGPGMMASLTRDGRHLYTSWAAFESSEGEVGIFDLEAGTYEAIPSHGTRALLSRLDPSGGILLTAGWDNAIRVGPATGEEPHILLGHDDGILSLVVSPDGRWIASAGKDATVRLWPMPDPSRPPLQTLPYDELIAKLKSFTNRRVVPDPKAPNGYATEIEPFTGWGELPAW